MAWAAVLLGFGAAAAAGQATRPATAPGVATVPATAEADGASRADVARAYLRFERAYRDHPPERERVPEVNRAFDALTLQFFAGRGATAERALDRLTESLTGRAVEPSEEDPFAARPGEFRLEIGAAKVPALLAYPKAPAGHRMPLVIALHGAGGTEDLFMAGYGAGRLKELAAERGFILLCPATLAVLPARTFVADAVAAIEARAAEYPSVDPDRVYLIGHSLGAFAATAVAVREGDRLAALCLIAGAGRIDLVKHLPPTLLIAGGLDPIVKSERVADSFERARQAGKSVEMRVMGDHGHTLVVGDALPGVVDWLLPIDRGPGD